MKINFYALLSAGVLLAGCQSAQDVVKTDPKGSYQRCIASTKKWDITSEQQLRAFMGVSKERAPVLFCQRLLKAVASGRVSESDLNRLQTERATEVFKVLKGR